MSEAFDFIVVGGGSAGCIVAARLLEANAGRVLLLECGEPAEANPETLTAEGYKYAFANDRVMWDRFTVPQQHCGNRRLYAGTGRGMGGSGSVNGMVYTRGDRKDYDQWPEGWHWGDLRPDFEGLETRLRPHRRGETRFTKTAVEAATQVGFDFKEDLNDGDLAGYFGYEWMSYEGEQRRSSYVAFVQPLRDDPNLVIRTGARTTRLVFDEHMQATAVEYRDAAGLHQAECRKEVVMCAGSLETPKVLMLSGIGPRADLERVGVPVVLDQPRIGENLHDHPNVTLFFKGDHEVDCYYPQLYGFDRTNPATDLPEGQPDTCYVMYAVRSSFHQAAKRMIPALALPNWMYRFAFARKALRSMIDLLFKFGFVQRFVERMYGVVVILGKPASRGRVRLASKDPVADLEIDPNYYAESVDLETMRKGVEKARAIAGAPAFSSWGNRPLIPSGKTTSRDKLTKWIHGATMTTFHFSGTCMMGEGDEAPVDTQLRLKGVRNVRIADASVVPVVPVSAMNAPSMVIGWCAADLIVTSNRK